MTEEMFGAQELSNSSYVENVFDYQPKLNAQRTVIFLEKGNANIFIHTIRIRFTTFSETHGFIEPLDNFTS